ncbi:MAG: DUF922 domain-containing protein [Chitinophagaceae bacterium]
MIKLRKAILLMLLYFPGVLFAQNGDEEVLDWNANRKLTWADYKATPNPDSDAAATTTTYLKIEYNIRSNNFSFKIQSKFSKSRSWGLHKSAYILSHEQGHFDIAEIFARKLNKEMSNYQFNNKTFQKELKEIYNNVIDEKTEMQNDYDRETNHSINKEKQEKWNRKIVMLLEELKEYAVY